MYAFKGKRNMKANALFTPSGSTAQKKKEKKGKFVTVKVESCGFSY